MKITDFIYTCLKNFPTKKSANKMVIINNRKKYKIKSVLRLRGIWNYRAYDILGRITTKSKTLQLQNFSSRYFLC